MGGFDSKCSEKKQSANGATAFLKLEYGIGSYCRKKMHNEHNENAEMIAKFRTINKNMVRDIFRIFFINGTPFESTQNHMAGWIGTIENAKWNTPYPMLNYLRKNKQQQNFKNCTKNKFTEFGKKYDAFVKSMISGKNDRELYKMHLKRMATVVKLFGYDVRRIKFYKISIGRCTSTEFPLYLFFDAPETTSGYIRPRF